MTNIFKMVKTTSQIYLEVSFNRDTPNHPFLIRCSIKSLLFWGYPLHFRRPTYSNSISLMNLWAYKSTTMGFVNQHLSMEYPQLYVYIYCMYVYIYNVYIICTKELASNSHLGFALNSTPGKYPEMSSALKPGG